MTNNNPDISKLNDGIDAIVAELKQQNAALEAQIAEARRPRRSQMTRAEKTAFIAEHGKDAFLALPLK